MSPSSFNQDYYFCCNKTNRTTPLKTLKGILMCRKYTPAFQNKGQSNTDCLSQCYPPGILAGLPVSVQVFRSKFKSQAPGLKSFCHVPHHCASHHHHCPPLPSVWTPYLLLSKPPSLEAAGWASLPAAPVQVKGGTMPLPLCPLSLTTTPLP